MKDRQLLVSEAQKRNIVHEIILKFFSRTPLRSWISKIPCFILSMDWLGTALQEAQLVQKKEIPKYSHHNMDMCSHRLLTLPGKLSCQEFSPKRALIHCIIKKECFPL